MRDSTVVRTELWRLLTAGHALSNRFHVFDVPCVALLVQIGILESIDDSCTWNESRTYGLFSQSAFNLIWSSCIIMCPDSVLTEWNDPKSFCRRHLISNNKFSLECCDQYLRIYMTNKQILGHCLHTYLSLFCECLILIGRLWFSARWEIRLLYQVWEVRGCAMLCVCVCVCVCVRARARARETERPQDIICVIYT